MSIGIFYIDVSESPGISDRQAIHSISRPSRLDAISSFRIIHAKTFCPAPSVAFLVALEAVSAFFGVWVDDRTGKVGSSGTAFEPFLAVRDNIVRLLVRFFDSENFEFSFCASFYTAPVSLTALRVWTLWRGIGLVWPGIQTG